jgi:hypothetical protein
MDLRDITIKIEDYINKRVIEELEVIINNLDSPWDRDMVRKRIKEQPSCDIKNQVDSENCGS